MITFKSKAILYLFVICLFIAILFPLINIFFIYPSVTGLLIENTEDNAVRPGTHLARDFFKDDRPVSTEEIQEHADLVLHDLGLMKLKIFKPSGEIIYSTESIDIGKINNKDYFHRIVKAGKPFTKIVNKDTKSLEAQKVSADVVETYVPVTSGGRFIGAFEMYYNVTEKNRALHSAVIKYSIIPFALMCSFLFVIASEIDRADVRVEVTGLPRVEADPMQMRHLMENLIENAIKFRRPDKPAEVRISGRYVNAKNGSKEYEATDDELCEIQVEDNGIGFDEKYAERHGGSITAKSSPGEGSSFIFTLPVRSGKGETNV